MRSLKTEEWVKIFNAYDEIKNRRISKFKFEHFFSIRQNYWNKESLRRMFKKERCIIWIWIFSLKLAKQAKKAKGRQKEKESSWLYMNWYPKRWWKRCGDKKYYRIFNKNNIDADIKNIKEIEKLS